MRHCCHSNRSNTLFIDSTWYPESYSLHNFSFILFRNIHRPFLTLKFSFFFTFQETVGNRLYKSRKINNVNSLFGIPISCIRKNFFFLVINLLSFKISSINLFKMYWSGTIKFETAYPKNELGMSDYIERCKLTWHCCYI